MKFLPPFIIPFLNELSLISWPDCIEIVLLSIGIYYFLKWLASDKEKNLCGYAISYSGLIFVSYYTQMSGLYTLLTHATPCVCCMLILFHQQLLQRNFLALKKIATPLHTRPANWLDTLLKTTLHVMNNKKGLIWIIEKSDSLNQFISAPYTLHADISPELLSLITTHEQSPQDTPLLWISHDGKLRALEVSWNIQNIDLWLTPAAQQLIPWQQAALCATTQTDCLIFASCPQTRTCSLIYRGMIAENLSPVSAHALLRKLLNSDSLLPEGVLYASRSSVNISEQQLS